MRYKIIKGGGIYSLMEEVQSHIDLGWKPQGGVSTGGTHGSYVVSPYYIQAMMKE